MSIINQLIKKTFLSNNDRHLYNIRKTVEKINSFENSVTKIKLFYQSKIQICKQNPR